MYLCQIINQNTYNDKKYSLLYVTVYYEVIIVYYFFILKAPTHFTMNTDIDYVKTNVLSTFLYAAGHVDKISQ